jgi:glutamate racemase
MTDETASVEQTVTGVLSRVLGTDEVPADRNFFELGGDSIGAMRVAAELADELPEAAPLDADLISFLLEAPTVSELIEKIDSRSSA